MNTPKSTTMILSERFCGTMAILLVVCAFSGRADKVELLTYDDQLGAADSVVIATFESAKNVIEKKKNEYPQECILSVAKMKVQSCLKGDIENGSTISFRYISPNDKCVLSDLTKKSRPVAFRSVATEKSDERSVAIKLEYLLYLKKEANEYIPVAGILNSADSVREIRAISNP